MQFCHLITLEYDSHKYIHHTMFRTTDLGTSQIEDTLDIGLSLTFVNKLTIL